jgi:hypothetical protein
MKSRRLLVLAAMAVVCLNTACGDQGGNPTPVNIPADFSARHYFSAGSVAPKYYFTTYIAMNNVGYDTLSMSLGYDFETGERPTRTERFDASVGQMQDLYDAMVEHDIFRGSWQVLDEPPCGASSQALEVTADGRQYYVPPYVIDTESVTAVYLMIHGLPPEATWDSLWAWRDRYIASQP